MQKLKLLTLPATIMGILITCGCGTGPAPVLDLRRLDGIWVYKAQGNVADINEAPSLTIREDGSFTAKSVQGKMLNIDRLEAIGSGHWSYSEEQGKGIIQLVVHEKQKDYHIGGYVVRNGDALSLRFDIGDPDNLFFTEFAQTPTK